MMRSAVVAASLVALLAGCRDKQLDVQRAEAVRELHAAVDDEAHAIAMSKSPDGRESQIAGMTALRAARERATSLRAKIADIDSVQAPAEQSPLPSDPQQGER